MEKYFCILQSGISGITRVLTLTTEKRTAEGTWVGGGGQNKNAALRRRRRLLVALLRLRDGRTC